MGLGVFVGTPPPPVRRYAMMMEAFLPRIIHDGFSRNH